MFANRSQRSEAGTRRSEVRGRRPVSFRRPIADLLFPNPARRSGQAAIELIAGLLMVLLLVTGIIHVNRMARVSLFLHAVLRGIAGEQAMESGTVASAPNYISDWQAGADGQRYTADDQPVRNGAKLPAILDTLVNDSAKKEDDWRRVQDSTLLPVSMIHLHSSPLLATMISFVHQEETIHLNVDPVLRQLVYGKDQVAIKEEVWMPLMGGLY